jgi:hypothetical protein
LYDFVDFLGDSIDALNDVNEKLSKVLDFVVVGCVSSFMLRLGFQVYRRFISFGEEKIFQLKDISKRLLPGNKDLIKFNVENDADQKYCNKVAENIRIAIKLDKNEKNPIFGLRLEHFSDKDLAICFPKVASAWDTEAFWYNTYRLTCDRVFGHKTPSKWTENLKDKDILDKIQEGNQCGAQSVKGQPLRAVECRDLKDQFPRAEKKAIGQKCFVIREKSGNRETVSLYELGPNVGGDAYQLNKIDGDSQLTVRYAIKQTEKDYLTNQPRTCENICLGEDEDGKSGKFITEEGPIKIFKSSSNDEKGIGAICTEANTCTSWGVEEKIPGNTEIEVKETFRRGYTSDCFFENNNPSTISDDSTTRLECCCINTAGDSSPDIYYIFDDVNKYVSPAIGNQPGGQKVAFESKENPDNPPKEPADMEWSYRYWKENYITLQKKDKETEHSRFNPDRYIEGRDFPACFGQNNWVFDYNVPAGQTGKLVTIDSKQQHTSAFQCANIAGVQNRLTMINNMQSALASCLIDVRRTGTSDAAACKELFTRYICSSIWQVISLFTDNCAPFSLGIGVEDEDDYLGIVKDGFRSVSDSVSDSMSELQSEYGNAELNNLIGAGQGEIARKVCLGAFGYDWDFNLENVIDAAYSQSFATLVQRTTATREYLTIHPTMGQATYDYRASWIVNPGCDLENYKVDLVCVNRDEMNEHNGIRCDKIGSPDGSNCDCLDSDASESDRSERFFSSKGRLSQNEFVQGEWSEIITSDYRYDHLKFTLRADRDLRGSLQDTCFPQGHEDGEFYFNLRDKSMRDITACVADITSGIYRCSGGLDFWSQKGLGRIDEILINDDEPEDNKVTVFIGDPLTITPTIFKTPGSSNKCLVAELDRNLDRNSLESLPQVIVIDRDGSIQYPAATLINNIQPSTNIRELREPKAVSCDSVGDACDSMKNKKLSINKIERENKMDVDIILTFNDIGGSKEIELTDSSNDIMVVNGIEKRIGAGGWWDDEFKGPVVDISGVKFKITDVPFDDKLKSITYELSVPPVDEDGRPQTWTLKLSLFEADEDTGGCSRYNAGELTEYENSKQQKTYRITIKSPAELAGYPKIKLSFGKDDKGNTKNYLNPIETDEVKLNIEITDDIGINKRIDYDITPPGNFRGDGGSIDCPLTSISGTEEKRKCSLEFNMEELGVDNSKTGGDYDIKVYALDTDPTPHLSEEKQSIEVRCGPSGTSYGQCFKIDKCVEEQIISGGDIGCQQGYECCSTKQITT